VAVVETAGPAVPNRAAPYDSVVLVESAGPYGAVHGSGVLVAPDEVLTCAHVVWRSDAGAATAVAVAPALNGADEPYGVIGVRDFHFYAVSDPGDLLTPRDSQYDFALLHLSQSVPGVAPMALAPGFSGGPLHATGYPDYLGGTVMDDVLTTAARLPSVSDLELDDSLGSGMSGGPLWQAAPAPQGLQAYCLGVVSTGHFNGELTPAVLAAIQGWEAQDRNPGLAPAGAPAASLGLPQAVPPPGFAALAGADLLGDLTARLLGGALPACGSTDTAAGAAAGAVLGWFDPGGAALPPLPGPGG
jgi:V8-like Glu-specific endopeptidase